MTSIKPERGDPSVPSDAPWTDYVATILRSWRLVLYGTLAAWAVILIAAIAIPRDYVGTATVSLPDLIVPPDEDRKPNDAAKNSAPLVPYTRLDRSESWKRTGVPIALYKEMEKTLSDQAVLESALKGHLEPSDIGRFLDKFEEHFATLTTNPRDEMQRIERADGITAVVVSYKAHPLEEARAVTETLARLVRDAFVTTLARQEIRHQMMVSSRGAAQARQDYMNLASGNESLERQVHEMDRLLREAPVARGPQPQVMVNTEDRGYLYVSPASQLVGVKAAMAENAHLMRTFQREAAINELRLSLLRRIEARLQAEGDAARSPLPADVPGIVRAELDSFLKDQTGGAADYVRAQTLGLCDILKSAGDIARMVQSPTLRPTPRAWRVVGAMGAVLVLVLSAAILVESWRRRPAEARPRTSDAA